LIINGFGLQIEVTAQCFGLPIEVCAIDYELAGLRTNTRPPKTSQKLKTVPVPDLSP
jgi:hypothetical protein